jgi:hypothetical protein
MEKGAAGEIRRELDVPEIGGSLEALADEFVIEESEDGDYLIVRFAGLSSA